MTGQSRQAQGAPFQGRWRIVEMEVWAQDDCDMLEPAFIRFDGEQGEMRFICVVAWLSLRFVASEGAPLAEFSWFGADEGTECGGHGWVELKSAGRLRGHIAFQHGDESAFNCEKW